MSGITGCRSLVLWLGLAAGCGGNMQAVLELAAAADHLPCAGMQRLRVTVFRDEQNGQGRDGFGKFYGESGECDLPVGLPLQIDGLPFSDHMWILVEGFDSSERRRLNLAQSDVFDRADVESGRLAPLVLQREPVGGEYPTATVVIDRLDGLLELEPVDSLEFRIEYSLTQIVNGSFYPEPGRLFGQRTLTVSSLGPQSGLRLLVTARRGATYLASWEQPSFDIPPDVLFVNVEPTRK